MVAWWDGTFSIGEIGAGLQGVYVFKLKFLKNFSA
jgi:hypothetical protein